MIEHYGFTLFCFLPAFWKEDPEIAGAAQIVFLYNFIHSMFYGKKTVQNPWRSNTLEWTAPIEHFHGNWEGEIPHVHRWAYDYSKPGHEEDFVPQHIPLKKGEEELQH